MEESGEIKGEDPHHRWIVDPLDGTTNFLHGLPHFCISIAYERKGVVEAGVIYAPLTDEVFWAEKGSGAFLNFTRLRVSEQKDMDAVAIATGQTDNMAKPREYFGALRVTGSTALDLAYVAAGKYDGFFINHLKPWDIAAGMLLVQEAGGYVESFDGKTSPLESETLVTGSYHTFKVLRQLVRT